jgi:SAM-dependent methyltransferase
MSEKHPQAFSYFQSEYSSHGFDAQRRYPNEELCRFMGRNFFSVPPEIRSNLRIVEVGCGAGANLWMIAKEGFHAIGIDLSPAAIDLCKQMMSKYGCEAELHVASMTEIPLEENSCDALVDIFSSHCLPHKQGIEFLNSAHKCLKSGGKFFSYFPSKNSDTWTKDNHPDPEFNQKTDAHSLNGLHRTTGPYYGNDHPFRFYTPDDYEQFLNETGFTIDHCETLTRTYQNRHEIFEFVVIEATKK